MAAHHHKPSLLHELLKEDQEPFHLKTFIAQRRSNLNSNSNNNRLSTATTLHHLKKRSSSSRHASSSSCFFSFNSSPNKSPFLDFRSPAQSPCKNNLLHIPPNVVEAAMRVQRQQQQSKKSKHIGLGLFGSFLKRLKDRSSKNKKTRAIVGDNKNNTRVSDKIEQTTVRLSSCSCNSSRTRRVKSNSADWTGSSGSKDLSKSVDLWASSSSDESSEDEDEEEAISATHDFGFPETRLCGDSPFRFSLHRSNSSSSSGSPRPDFCSPVASPSCHVAQEKDYENRNPGNVQGQEEEDKEQCSPVSVLDPPFEEDDEHESQDAEVDDDDDPDPDPDRSYANIQRARQQLLNSLRRFEKLAELDPIELDRELVEGSDDENLEEREESEVEEPRSPHKRHNVDTFVTEVLSQSSLRHNSSRRMSADMKRLVSDLITEEKGEVVNKEVVFGSVCSRLDSWKDVESNTIDMMIEFDFKGESCGWRKFSEQMEEIAAEIELGICRLLLEELTEEVFYIREEHVQLCIH